MVDEREISLRVKEFSGDGVPGNSVRMSNPDGLPPRQYMVSWAEKGRS
jgi:hypothetical protein